MTKANVGAKGSASALGAARERGNTGSEALHSAEPESSRKVRDADVNHAITKLCEKKDAYAAEDRWHFEKLP